jgi:hypothetical protein
LALGAQRERLVVFLGPEPLAQTEQTLSFLQSPQVVVVAAVLVQARLEMD